MTTTIIQTRAHLVDLLPPGSLVIELGVAAGLFAEEMLTRNPQIRYLGIDRWSDHHDVSEMLQAADRVRPFQTPHFITSTFSRAVTTIDDASADMIYIDGYAHTGQERGETLRDWWPKLKPGGIFAGHDYDPEYPQTIAAVDEFARQHALQIHLTGEPHLPSWWVLKP